MVIVNFKVLGKDWRLRILKKKKYVKKNGDDSLAITLSWKRTMDINIKAFRHGDVSSLETIIHELHHAYLGELCTHSADLSKEDFEEICSELMSKWGRELLDLADTILLDVKSLIEPKQEQKTRKKL